MHIEMDTTSIGTGRQSDGTSPNQDSDYVPAPNSLEGRLVRIEAMLAELIALLKPSQE